MDPELVTTDVGIALHALRGGGLVAMPTETVYGLGADAEDPAAVALDALKGSPSEKDVVFYNGKVAAAKFFAHQRFPLLAAERAIAESADNDLMDLDEATF